MMAADQKNLLSRVLRERFPFPPTPCQERLFERLAEFLSAGDAEADIMVVDGHAGTGKTSAMAAVVGALRAAQVPVVLLAPTGRSAKVFSRHAGCPASTIHKYIYRQKLSAGDGEAASVQFGLFVNKARGALFIVDEVSLIGTADAASSRLFGSGDLLADLVRFVRSGVGCKLLLVGDGAQLPPVGQTVSPALSPACMAGFGGVWHAALLDNVVRQEALSGILANAQRLRSLMEGGDAVKAAALCLRAGEDVRRIGGAELLDALSDAYATYGEEETLVLCRSNARAVRYNAGIRAQALFREEALSRGDRLMVVRNNYAHSLRQADYIANGDMARLVWIRRFEERHGFHYADACLEFTDYGEGEELETKVLLDTLESTSPALSQEQMQGLYQAVSADYAHIASHRRRHEAVLADPYYSALQLKHAYAVTCHKAQGGQWDCVFIDFPFRRGDDLSLEDVKWLYTAFTRAVRQVFLVNFPDTLFLGIRQ